MSASRKPPPRDGGATFALLSGVLLLALLALQAAEHGSLRELLVPYAAVALLVLSRGYTLRPPRTPVVEQRTGGLALRSSGRRLATFVAVDVVVGAIFALQLDGASRVLALLLPAGALAWTATGAVVLEPEAVTLALRRRTRRIAWDDLVDVETTRWFNLRLRTVSGEQRAARLQPYAWDPYAVYRAVHFYASRRAAREELADGRGAERIRDDRLDAEPGNLVA